MIKWIKNLFKKFKKVKPKVGSFFSLQQFGDGTKIDLQDNDGTVGTSKGAIIVARDTKNKARLTAITGVRQDELKTQDPNTDLLKELLVEQKKTNKYLSLLTEVEFEDINIEQ